MREPAQLTTRPDQAINGSPAPQGATVEAGGRVALTFTNYVVPVYPADSAHPHRSGLVTLAFSVVPPGTVAAVRVLRSTGSKPMDRAATDAVRRWRFAPFRARLVRHPPVEASCDMRIAVYNRLHRYPSRGET